MENRERENIIKELISTEEKYLQDLTTMINVYKKPLEDSKILSDTNIKTIFINVNILMNVSAQILKQLKEYYAEYKKNSGYFSGGHSIGKIFLKVAPFFATYTEYCNKYDQGANLIRTLKKENEKFTELLTKLERPHKQKGGLPLVSYLIMPVQRVPRYELLLRELLKCSDPSLDDYENLEKAIEKVKATTAYMNEKLKVFDNKKKLVVIQNRLDAPKIFQESLIANATITSSSRRKGSLMNLMTPRGSGSNLTPVRSSVTLSPTSPTPKQSPENNQTPRKMKSFRESLKIHLTTPRGKRGSLLNFMKPTIEEEEEAPYVEEETIEEEPKFNIIEPHRTFVHEGVLKVFTKEEEVCNELTESQKKKAKRNTLLFSDMILFCIEGPTAGSLIYKSQQMLNSADSIPWCREIDNEMFQLITHDVTYTLIANSIKEKEIWMSKIHDTIEAIVTKGTISYEKIGKAQPLYTPLILSLLTQQQREEIEEKRKSARKSRSKNPVAQNSIEAFNKIKEEAKLKSGINIQIENETIENTKEKGETKESVELTNKQHEITINIESPISIEISKPPEVEPKEIQITIETEKENKNETNVEEKESTVQQQPVAVTPENKKDEGENNTSAEKEKDVNSDSSKEDETKLVKNELFDEKLKLDLDLKKLEEAKVEPTKKSGRTRNFSLTARLAGRAVSSARDKTAPQENKKEESSGCVVS